MGGMTRATRAALIKFALLTGAADSDTVGITCTAQDGTAIAVGDILISVVELAGTTNAWTNRTSVAAIIAGGKVTTTASSGKTIGVLWMACSAERQVSSPMIVPYLVTGGSGAADLTATGISTSDSIICAIVVNSTTGAWTDRTSHTTIYAANVVRCSDSTAGAMILVLCMDESGPRAFSALNLQFVIGTIDASPTSEPSTVTATGITTKDKVLVAIAADETDFDLQYDLTEYVSVSATDTLLLTDQPSPIDTPGSKVLVFYQKGNDI